MSVQVHAIYDHDFVQELLVTELQILKEDLPDIDQLNQSSPLVLQALFRDDVDALDLASVIGAALNNTIAARQPMSLALWQRTIDELISIYRNLSLYCAFIYGISKADNPKTVPNEAALEEGSNRLSFMERSLSKRYLKLVKKHKVVKLKEEVESYGSPVIKPNSNLSEIATNLRSETEKKGLSIGDGGVLPLPWCAFVDLDNDGSSLPSYSKILMLRTERTSTIRNVLVAITKLPPKVPKTVLDLPLDGRCIAPICWLALQTLNLGLTASDYTRVSMCMGLYHHPSHTRCLPPWISHAMFRSSSCLRQNSTSHSGAVSSDFSHLLPRLPRVPTSLDQTAAAYASIVGIRCSLNVRALIARIIRLLDLHPKYYALSVVLANQQQAQNKQPVVFAIAVVLVILRLWIPSFRVPGYPSAMNGDEAAFYSLQSEFEAIHPEPLLSHVFYEQLLPYHNFRQQSPTQQVLLLDAFRTYTTNAGEESHWRSMGQDFIAQLESLKSKHENACIRCKHQVLRPLTSLPPNGSPPTRTASNIYPAFTGLPPRRFLRPSRSKPPLAAPFLPLPLLVKGYRICRMLGVGMREVLPCIKEIECALANGT
eukprot:Gregarina_sp_Poly_1__11321@NODE_948_length_5588_cov_118_430538_g672_i0_p1_GENE_NODE_948_length_5588_cov_118_430538_g672_i0NODE_948_length_5588_cov_118_430538_g672_i0_p1_ORF_typecomplete_len597_score69_20GLTSCR1/PF15249_6/0_35_NODE_948_length_5588_cov_118_430538_g672_i024344224